MKGKRAIQFRHQRRERQRRPQRKPDGVTTPTIDVTERRHRRLNGHLDPAGGWTPPPPRIFGTTCPTGQGDLHRLVINLVALNPCESYTVGELIDHGG
jgi:hypothetical protein